MCCNEHLSQLGDLLVDIGPAAPAGNVALGNPLVGAAWKCTGGRVLKSNKRNLTGI